MAEEPPVTEVIKLQLAPPLAIITLNNPRKLNALDGDQRYRLSSVLQDIAKNPKITVTILTGTGRFFSAGADFSISRPGAAEMLADPDANESAQHEARRNILRSFAIHNLDLTRAFYTHPKILVVALNGPAVGISAAVLGFADFIYATPSTYILVPFSSLGLVAEGGASVGFVNRMGISLANEALLMSRKIQMPKLLASGFVNQEFPGDEHFLDNVIAEVKDKLGEHLVPESVLNIKSLIREREKTEMEAQGVREIMLGMDQFVKGVPQEEFRKLASGEKRHKL